MIQPQHTKQNKNTYAYLKDMHCGISITLTLIALQKNTPLSKLIFTFHHGNNGAVKYA